jgi:hypothetical protein
MLNFEAIYLINSQVSKQVINNIVNNEKIDFTSLQIEKYKKKINEIIKLYNNLKLNDKAKCRNDIFWQIIKKKYKKIRIYQTTRNQIQKSDKIDVNIENLNENLGFKPSLLSLMIFDEEIKNILKFGEFFQRLKKICNLVEFNFFERISFINALSKNNQINLITPLCPDYDYVKISSNLYKYTFNKLNADIGLIGNSVVNFKKDLLSLFKEYNFTLNYHLLYGDFEAFSKSNCERLSINEDIFINKLNLSAKNLKKKFPEAKEVALMVSKLSTKINWITIHQKNYSKLTEMFYSNKKFKENVLNILQSRMALYENWFPNLKNQDYINIILNQGAEYTTMGDLFYEKYSNFCVLGMDHFKMSFFYCINNKIPVIYGRKNYE